MMVIVLRTLLALIVAALAPAAARGADAQDYPNRPIKLVVAFTAGGTTDFVARLLAERLRTLLGQPVIVENRPGANGAIAAEYVAKSDPDGYTLFFTTVGAVAVNPALRGNLAYDPIKDFAPVGMAVFNSTMLVVNASMPVNSANSPRWRPHDPVPSPSASPGSAPSPTSGLSSSRRPPASSSRPCPIGARLRR
jgi:tripartite-type tricarboxylate transporter receptor subunit TctC